MDETTSNKIFDLEPYVEREISDGKCVILMPQGGVFDEGNYEESTFFEEGFVTFAHQNSIINLEKILKGYKRNRSNSIAHVSSAFTQFSEEVVLLHSLAIFSCESNEVASINNAFDVKRVIEKASEKVFNALNPIRLMFCQLGNTEGLPHLPGNWFRSSGYKGLVIIHPNKSLDYYACNTTEDFSTHSIGIGLTSYDSHRVAMHPYLYPMYISGESEVAKMIQHSLKMYNRALYANSDTLMYINLMALFEYLGTGNEFKPFAKVRKKLQAHLASSIDEYEKLGEMFQLLTSKKINGVNIGYRTRIIHEGAFLEDLIESSQERHALFMTLSKYIKKIIDGMCQHSDESFEELQNHRRDMVKRIFS